MRRDMDEMDKMEMQPLQDMKAFNVFMLKKTSEYFNEKAAKNPASAEEALALSAVFAKASTIIEKAVTAGAETSPEEEELLMEMEESLFKLDMTDEMEKVEAYCLSKSAEFANADPARWARMEKYMPEAVKEIKAFQK